MQEMNSVNQLIAVAKGFERFVCEEFYGEGLIMCHPILPILFLSRGLEYIPEKRVRDIKIFNTLITSTDGINWGFGFDKMIDIVESGGNFYIADFKLNVYMSIEHYMLDKVIMALGNDMRGIVSLPNFKWKKGRVGELAYFTMNELVED